VDDAIDAVGAVLQGDEFADGAEIVAEMQVPGRLDAGKDELPEGGHDVSLACGGPFGHDPEAPGLRRNHAAVNPARRGSRGGLMNDGPLTIKGAGGRVFTLRYRPWRRCRA